MTDASLPNLSSIDAIEASPAELSTETVDPTLDLEISTEKLPGRHRRIQATLTIPCPAEQVWRVLTDYDHLADFIPNLALSRRAGKTETGTLLEQVGAQCFLNIQFCARVLLHMVEQFPERLAFSMVEGDFKTFAGAWTLQSVTAGATEATRLHYEVTVCPPRAIPAILIEKHLRRDLRQNLQAVWQRAIALNPA